MTDPVPPVRFVRDDDSDPAVEQDRALYAPFTQAVRELVDATIRTTVDEDTIRQATAEVEAITQRLRASQLEGSYGANLAQSGSRRPWSNAVIGVRNAIAPPVRTEATDDGHVWADFHLGAAYEGPPGLVHGGVSALILDQMLGESAGAGGRPGMTGTLTLRYRQGTPLGDLRAEAWIDRAEGIKTWAKGHLIGPEGVCVEAEGVFILPKWARAQFEGEPPREPTYFE